MSRPPTTLLLTGNVVRAPYGLHRGANLLCHEFDGGGRAAAAGIDRLPSQRLDSFEITGWSFNALIAVRGDVVVFASCGGERRTHRLEQNTSPLVPLQGAGEAAAAGLVR
jgi:hypothetical protein